MVGKNIDTKKVLFYFAQYILCKVGCFFWKIKSFLILNWQHNWNAWNEWQLHIRETNISDFDIYLKEPNEISRAITEAYLRNLNQNRINT
jgi:hypothetical protein